MALLTPCQWPDRNTMESLCLCIHVYVCGDVPVHIYQQQKACKALATVKRKEIKLLEECKISLVINPSLHSL